MSNKKFIDKKTRYGADSKTGVRSKVGTAVKFEDGSSVLLLNPNGKGMKYVKELREGRHYTNTNEVKKDKKGNPLRLNDCQRAYRSGYLQARKDNAKAYNAKNK